jgi:hypothetical protein
MMFPMPTHRRSLLAAIDWIDRYGFENGILIVLFAVTVTSLGVLLLTLRDSRGRFSLRLLFLLTAYVALAVCAIALFLRVVYRPI